MVLVIYQGHDPFEKNTFDRTFTFAIFTVPFVVSYSHHGASGKNVRPRTALHDGVCMISAAERSQQTRCSIQGVQQRAIDIHEQMPRQYAVE
jgi:hypothetical protein